MNSVAVFHKGEEMKSYITGKVLMIRPVHFAYNEETAVNNYYQKKDLKEQIKYMNFLTMYIT